MRYERDGFSVEAARKKGRQIPDDHWINDEPEIVPYSEVFLEAYRDLATCRPPDGPIPWDKAMAYADRKGFAPDLAEVLWAVVWRIDVAERNWRVEQLKAETRRA